MDEKSEFETTLEQYQQYRTQFNNPIVIGTMLHKLTQERESNNLVLREINAKLDRLSSLEERLSMLEAKLGQGAGTASVAVSPSKEDVLLADIDSDIVSFVKGRGKVCAEDVMQQFHYKGTNAASSRLNRLVRQGLLRKAQVGRKVYFLEKP